MACCWSTALGRFDLRTRILDPSVPEAQLRTRPSPPAHRAFILCAIQLDCETEAHVGEADVMTMRRRQAGLGVVLAIVMLGIPGLLAGLRRQPVQPVAAARHTTTPAAPADAVGQYRRTMRRPSRALLLARLVSAVRARVTA